MLSFIIDFSSGRTQKENPSCPFHPCAVKSAQGEMCAGSGEKA